MQLSDILNQTGSLQSIARELGIDEHEAASAVSAMPRRSWAVSRSRQKRIRRAWRASAGC